MMLDHYQQTKNLLVSYPNKAQGILLTGHAPPRVLITEAAAELLRRLRERHGPVMFHQSGGCCDGSSPMCYPDGEFIVGTETYCSVSSTVLRCGFPVPSSTCGSTRNC